MSDKKLPKLKLVLGATKGKLIRFSYLNVHEARLNGESGNMEFSVAALIPKENVEDIAAIKGFIDGVKKSVWLDEKKAVPPKFWNPLRDGDNDLKNDGSSYGAEAKGCYVLNTKTGEDSPPNVVGKIKGSDGKFLPLGPKEIKSGDWGRLSINLGAYIKGTSGVGAYLSSVQLVEQGDPLGSQTTAEDDFGDFDDDDDMLD
jgi:hypothetical protein